MNDEIVLNINHLTKIYPLYQKHVDRLKEALHPLRKQYHQDFYALRDVTFQIKRGETVGIIGQNGSGKSTLLKILAGVLTPTAGEVVVQGKVSALLELGTGFNPEYTGIENIYLNGTIKGLTKADVDKRLDEIVSFADIGEFIHQPIKQYSSGMLARLAFGVSVGFEPDILIIDEALSVGDMRFQQRAIRRMKELICKAKALLFVSHSTATIRSLCDRAIWLNNGEIMQDGEVSDVIKSYETFINRRILIDVKQKTNKKENINNIISNSLTDILFDDVSLLPSYIHNYIDIQQIALYRENPFEKTTSFIYGENVALFIKFHTHIDLLMPTVTINIANKNGIIVIGINSYRYGYNLSQISENSDALIKLCFQLPYLAADHYSISLGISEVGDKTFIPHDYPNHFIYDACIFEIIKTKDIKSQTSALLVLEKIDIELKTV